MIKVKNKLKKDLRLVAIVCSQEENFLLNYYFDNKGAIETFKFIVPRNDTKIESISEEYPSADYYEREIHDFFGIEFVGNINLHLKLFLPDNWKGKPPMLKDDNNA